MQEIVNQIVCKSCAATFHCNSKNIEQCDCFNIQLTKQELEYISTKYSNCICNDCLLKLKDEYTVSKGFVF